MDVVSELRQMALETPSIIVTDERTSKGIVVAGDLSAFEIDNLRAVSSRLSHTPTALRT
jgi:hypothetical protein